MKHIKTTFLVFFVLTTQRAFNQCDSSTVEIVTNYVPLLLDSLIESEGLRNGPDYNGATLFFPQNAEGNLKSLVLVPGFQSYQNSVKPWARYLASRGFLCMTVGTNSIYESPNARANALLDGMESLRQENTRLSSPLYQKIDIENIALGGWSMGGGGAQLAAGIDSSINAVFAICPWLNPITLSPSEINHTSPLLIISGQFDLVSPNVQHSDIHYNYTPESTDKLHFEISGGDHYIPLSPSFNNGDAGNVVYAWLKLFLSNDDCYCGILSADSLDQNMTASNYQTNLNCPNILDLDKSKPSLSSLILSPNPNDGYFSLEIVQESIGSSYQIIDYQGRIIENGTIMASSQDFDISDKPKGLYVIRFSQEEDIESFKFAVQ